MCLPSSVPILTLSIMSPGWVQFSSLTVLSHQTNPNAMPNIWWKYSPNVVSCYSPGYNQYDHHIQYNRDLHLTVKAKQLYKYNQYILHAILPTTTTENRSGLVHQTNKTTKQKKWHLNTQKIINYIGLPIFVRNYHQWWTKTLWKLTKDWGNHTW